jgi:trans-aconitate 2-methyltransferase
VPGSRLRSMAEWDASRYHRISGPQFDWGQRVIARLQPGPGEWILDLGCGTGRLTQEIGASTPGVRVVGLDRSGAMLAVARETAALGARVRPRYVQGDGTALPFRGVFDAVFSAATLHWIRDHAAVFASVCGALRPGGRFVAQCGGAGNLARLLERVRLLMRAPGYAPWFLDWEDTWYFAGPDETAERLQTAGFVAVDTSLEPAPVDLPADTAYAEFISCVCIREHLARLPLQLREPFASELTVIAARDSPPFRLDYWRLNIAARRGAA